MVDLYSGEERVIQQELAKVLSEFLSDNLPSDFHPEKRITVLNNLKNFNDQAKKYEESIWTMAKHKEAQKYDIYWDDMFVVQIKATDTKRQVFVAFLSGFLDLYKNNMVFLSKQNKILHEEAKKVEEEAKKLKSEENKKELKKMVHEVADQVYDRI